MNVYANGKSGPLRAEEGLPRSSGPHGDWIHKMKKIAFLLASMGLAAAAQGATISFQYGLPIVQATTEINQTGLLGLFNPALGTLTGASLTYQSAATTTITLTNRAAQNQNARAASEMEILWSSSIASLTPLLAAPAMIMNFSTGAAQSYTPGQSRTFGPLTDSDSITQNLNSILASLVGVGTFGLTCVSETSLAVIGGGGNVRGAQSTTAGCGAAITYTYTPTPPTRTPEPGSLALVGMAAVGLGVAARRRKA